MRKRFKLSGKKIVLASILLIAAAGMCFHLPAWVERIPTRDPLPPVAHAAPSEEAIPEPTTMALLGLGGAALVYRRRRQSKTV